MATIVLKFDVTFLKLVENAIYIRNVAGVATQILAFTKELATWNIPDLAQIAPTLVSTMEEVAR
jgi:hypothetical protein